MDEEILALLKRYHQREDYEKRATPGGKAKIIDFIASRDSVLDEEILSIKKLTKVASHLIADGSILSDGELEKIINFNMEGAEVCRSGDSELEPDNLKTMECHFNAHAGSIAKTLYAKTRKLIWAKKWYEYDRTSADIGIIVDTKHSAFMFSQAADAAMWIFKRTKDFTWAEKAYDCYLLSAEQTESKKHCAHTYSHAGDVAKLIYSKTNDIIWAKRVYDGYKISAEKCIGVDDRHGAYTNGFAGSAAEAIYRKTKDITWLEIAYNHYEESAKLVKKFNEKDSVDKNRFAGRIAIAMLAKTKDPMWAERAIDGYNSFINYYKTNPDHTMNILVDTLKSQVDSLRERLTE